MDCLVVILGLDQRRRGQDMDRLIYIAKVVSIGCMIQSAVLFPLASEQAQWLQYTTLSTFIITTLAFTAVNSELLVEFGLYTVPVALLFLVLAVMQPASPRKELLPWLPSFIASVNVATVAIGQIHHRTSSRPRRHTLEDGPGGMPIGTWSTPSSLGRTSTTPEQSARQPLESAPHSPVMFGRYGPPSHSSRRTGDSEMSLSDGPGRCRSAWDLATLSFFPDREDGPASPSSWPRNFGFGAIHGFVAPEMDLDSESSTAGSDQSLLGQAHA